MKLKPGAVIAIDEGSRKTRQQLAALVDAGFGETAQTCLTVMSTRGRSSALVGADVARASACCSVDVLIADARVDARALIDR